jgi:hypothetical protein
MCYMSQVPFVLPVFADGGGGGGDHSNYYRDFENKFDFGPGAESVSDIGARHLE